MKTFTNVSTLLGLVASAAVFAQSGTPTPTPGSQPTNPSAASSPHQRAATKAPDTETPAASSGTSPSDSATPSQKDSLKKKHKAKPNKDGPVMDKVPPASP